MTDHSTGEIPSGSEQITEVQPAPTAPVPVDDATRHIDIQRGGLSASQIALVFISVALGAFLVGIGIGVATRAKPDEVVVASKVIGRSGGMVRFDGGQLRFPRGALGRNHRIVVYRSTFNDRIRVEGASKDTLRFQPGRLAAYRFAPTDIRFRRPVELTFRLVEGSRNAALFTRRDNTIVLLSGTVDTLREATTTEITDFRFEGRAGR